MPVIFRGSSEYDRNFRWNQSYRSASFSPNLEQNAVDAGLRSDQVGFVNGPRITAKKKVWHREPEVQHCLSWWPDIDRDTPVKNDAENDRGNIPNAVSPVKKPPKSRTVKRDSDNNKAQKIRIQKSSPKSPKKGTLSRRNNSLTSPVKARPASNPKSSPQKEGKQNSTSKGKKKGEKNIPTERADTSGNLDQDVTHPKTIIRHERNIPLERKAGVNPNGVARKSKARMSEYQRNFSAPKFSVKPSPVLSALDVVHSSSPAIPPHSGMQFNQSSEYISKYGSPRNDKRRPQTMTSPGSPSMKLRVKDMQRQYLTHQNKKGFRSEYRSQYEPTREFDVGELRKMAEDNKQKHEGTHIDPDHATQVISPFNKLWEVSTDDGTVRSDTVSGGNQDSKDERQSVKEFESEEKWSKMSQKGSDSIEDITEAAEVETLEADSLDERSQVSKYSVDRKHAWTEETNPTDEMEELSRNSHKSSSVLEGRVSTPRLHEIGGAMRTHHDLTTPSVGGAILTSPKHESDARSTSEMSLAVQERQKPQVAGSPTRDYHVLLEGRPYRLVRSSPQPLLPKQSKCPQKSIRGKEPPKPLKGDGSKSLNWRRSQSAELSPTLKKRSLAKTAPIRGSLRNNEFQHCGPTGRPQTAAILMQRDDDALSVASSHTSARATELLQRAKHRTSFWTTT